MNSHSIAVLEINLDQNKLNVGFFEQESTVQSYAQIDFARLEIERICLDMITIFNKAGQMGGRCPGAAQAFSS